MIFADGGRVLSLSKAPPTSDLRQANRLWRLGFQLPALEAGMRGAAEKGTEGGLRAVLTTPLSPRSSSTA